MHLKKKRKSYILNYEENDKAVGVFGLNQTTHFLLEEGERACSSLGVSNNFGY